MSMYQLTQMKYIVMRTRWTKEPGRVVAFCHRLSYYQNRCVSLFSTLAKRPSGNYFILEPKYEQQTILIR